MNKIVYTVLFYLMTFTVIAQTTTITLSNDPIENVIVYTDRDLYVTGEKIWFKANCYVTDGNPDHNLSRVLYIEIFNSTREYSVKQKYNISQGVAYGSIDIPLEFISGNYFLRAYTQFLKNYQPEHYFTSVISIIDPRVPLTKVNGGNHTPIEIIPEGNVLMEGIHSKVAVKIDNKISSDLQSIKLVDEENISISDINLVNKHWGIFEISPEKAKNYYIEITQNNGETILQPLPETSESGLLIKTKEDRDNNQLIIDVINQNNYTHQDYILVTASKNLKSSSENFISFNNGSYTERIPLDNLNEGINYILLIDQQNKIVNYHAVLIDKNEDIGLNIKSDKAVYGTREKVDIEISPQNLKENDYLNLSLAVVKKGTAYNLNELCLQLASNPQVLASYLNTDNVCKELNQSELDILMLYLNKELAEGTYINNLLEKPQNNFLWIPEIRDVSISGVVFIKGTDTPIPNIPVYISAFKENPQIHISKTNELGEFVFSLNNFTNNQNVFLCAKAPRLNEYEIRINNDFSHNFPRLKDVSLNIDTTYTELLEEMFINWQAGETYHTATGKKQLSVHHFPFNFDDPQITIRLDDYISTPNLATAIKEFVPAVKVHEDRGEYQISISNTRDRATYHYPLILVDNIPVFDVNTILEISPSSIERIDVHKFPVIIGDNFINGTFMLTTKTNDFGGIKMPEGSIFLEYQTITPSFAFDPQEYGNGTTKETRKADFRNLLYWNPDIIVNKTSNVSFYTSDHRSEYDIIIRGIDKEGKIIYKKTTLSVK